MTYSNIPRPTPFFSCVLSPNKCLQTSQKTNFRLIHGSKINLSEIHIFQGPEWEFPSLSYSGSCFPYFRHTIQALPVWACFMLMSFSATGKNNARTSSARFSNLGGSSSVYGIKRFPPPFSCRTVTILSSFRHNNATLPVFCVPWQFFVWAIATVIPHTIQ